MRLRTLILLACPLFVACGKELPKQNAVAETKPIVGTWRLVTGTLIEKGDTTVTDYTRNNSFIKVINNTHFAFLLHDVNKGKDSAAVFSAGGGSYSLTDSTYTEHLEYCSDRAWEGHDFPFTITIKNDTLTQRGIEKIESSGINRENIEKYVKVK
ncbi:hypothetical protein HUW51_23720 [Adhaeribacter swui]|uniref:Lipocalin family protein n=1 Tax=Adhaeribacter swui TaxID=2086471 RepID=A0A7G7GEI3_9BACT|nr:hypothetical protein [Adhaeribacter swui]QNF35567.1 hypothetical protein HUW51_23720 [Adhaeribacter swui]